MYILEPECLGAVGTARGPANQLVQYGHPNFVLMQHVSLAAIGRRATIETQDSLSDSFENHSSRETSSQSPELLPCYSGVASPPPPQLPRVLRLDEVLEHLRTVDLQLRALHTSRSPLPTPPPLVTSCGHEVDPAIFNGDIPSRMSNISTSKADFASITIQAHELQSTESRVECIFSTHGRAGGLLGRPGAIPPGEVEKRSLKRS
ncbi:hypothetical protein TSMEX_003214 [Taenia solium]|eukprot:TsM_001025200 transcript=TsM_001025200 gene=TsM_001025200